MAIDIGAEATDRATTFIYQRTIIGKDNPANASGTLKTIYIWANTQLSHCVVGTFYTTNGNDLKCRDSEAIGTVTAGSLQTFTGKSITVVTGDYIGMYYTAGRVESDASGFAGLWYIYGDYTTPDDETTYTFADGDAISLKGTDEEAATRSFGFIIG